MTKGWRNANGRSLPARVRGQVARQIGGTGDQDVLDGSGEEARRGVSAAAAPGRLGSAQAGRIRKASKYGNEQATLGDMKFDSRREKTRYQHLLVLQRAGEISDLERQVVYVLAPAVRIGGRLRPALRYIADFVYETFAGAVVIEDVKGVITEAYRIKRHLMAVKGFEIKEIK